MSEALKSAIARAVAGESFTAAEVRDVFAAIMRGEASPAQIGGLLIALRLKGETAEEIAGAARAMREAAAPMDVRDPETLVDTCGTGGDGSGTANISTLAAIVAAAAGGRVAKHGNRAQSSRSGSADVLEALGVRIESSPAEAVRCLEELGIAFLFAPAYHAATRHAAGPRRELGTRTLFNLLGPLTNPAGAANQVIGVFSAEWLEPVARALGQLGSRRVYVVHGAGGLDEIAVRGPTRVAEWNAARGEVSAYEITPADFGLAESDPDGLAGGDAERNAAIARAVLAGAPGPVRAAAIMEAATALCAAGAAGDFREGAERAAEAIDSGAAATKLEDWARWVGEVP
jgi:anthranilate phosphoribosyltransferase